MKDGRASTARRNGGPDRTQTVALLMRPGEDRSLLEEHLRSRYTVRTGATLDVLDDDVDLCFVEEPTFARHAESLDREKERRAPVFFPVVLLCRDAARARGDETVWSTVDDVLSIPVRRAELTARVSSLLAHRAGSRELDAHRQHLAVRNDRLDDFASDVAHDVRNPLEIAEGYVDQLRKEDDSDHLEEIALALERIDTIVEETLRIARGGLVVADPEPVDLGELATRAWNRCATEDGTLRFEDDPGTVRADSERLQTVFENLFRNAVEHGSTSSRPEADDAVEHGGTDVTVTVGSHAGGFFVEDDGPGIPEAERDDVFALGYTTSDDGTGRGLGIVERIVRAHEWEISLHEGTAGGTRFEIAGT